MKGRREQFQGDVEVTSHPGLWFRAGKYPASIEGSSYNWGNEGFVRRELVCLFPVSILCLANKKR